MVPFSALASAKWHSLGRPWSARYTMPEGHRHQSTTRPFIFEEQCVSRILIQITEPIPPLPWASGCHIYGTVVERMWNIVEQLLEWLLKRLLNGCGTVVEKLCYGSCTAPPWASECHRSDQRCATAAGRTPYAADRSLGHWGPPRSCRA